MPAIASRRLAPSPSIASVVESLFVSEHQDAAPLVAIPRPEIDVLIRFGPAASRGLDAYAFGGRERVHRKTVRGVRRTVSARLRLGATEAVLGVPASAITGRIVSLEELWGSASRRMFDQLASTDDALEAASILDAAIAERLALTTASRTTSLALDAARKLRDASFVSANVNLVAHELGVSERHLRRVFRDAFGVAPKTFAKLARFDRALCAARRAEHAGAHDTGWAGIAATAGYYDQSHLIAEFRGIAGATPRALLGELRGAASVG